MSKTLGINLGSNITTIYHEGNGVVVREPNAVAVDTYTQEHLAIGQARLQNELIIADAGIGLVCLYDPVKDILTVCPPIQRKIVFM